MITTTANSSSPRGFPQAYLVMVICAALAGGCSAPAEPEASHPMIYGGEPVATGEHPEVTALAYRKANGQWMIECSGTLISPKFVLTAGHCLDGLDSADGQDLRAHSDLKVYTGYGIEGGAVDGSVAHAVAAVHINPMLRAHPLGNADIGLIELQEAVTGITPARLPRSFAEAWQPLHQDKTRARLIGFGRREDGGRGIMYAVTVPVVSDNSHEMILGGAGKDSCSGDSGGPAYVQEGEQTLLAGVISRGLRLECGQGGYASLTADHACYISEVTGLASGSLPCGQETPRYSLRQLQRLDFLRLCAGPKTRPSQRATIDALLMAKGFTDCQAAWHELKTATRIDLKGLMLTDLSPLVPLRNLEHLDLTGNRLTALDHLLPLRRLKTVTVHGNAITDAGAFLRRFGKHPPLVLGQRAQLGNYTDTDFLKLCAAADTPADIRLTVKAILWKTMAEDCNTANLRLLSMRSLAITDRNLTRLEPLAGLPNLRDLDLSNNPVSDVSPLAGLESLEKLNTTGTGVTSHAVLDPLVARGLTIIH